MTLFSSLYGARLDRELGTDDPVLFTAARRKSAINEAQEAFAVQTECLRRQSTITIVGGTAEYDLNNGTTFPNADFWTWSPDPVQVIFTDASSHTLVLSGDDLPRRDPAWLDRYQVGWQNDTTASTTSQVPSLWYERIDGGSRLIGLVPKPCTGSSESMSLVVPYLARPTPMTSDTNEPFTVSAQVRADLRPYHQGLVHYGAYLLEKLRRDTQAAEYQLQRFLSYVTQYWQTQRRRQGQSLTFGRNYLTRDRSR